MVYNICPMDSLPPTAPPSRGGERKGQLAGADPGPCAKIQHFAQINKLPGHNKRDHGDAQLTGMALQLC